MAISLKLRRGTSVEHSNFKGEPGEVTVSTYVSDTGSEVTNDSSKPWTLRVHDGDLVGGHEIATVSGVQQMEHKTIANPIITFTSTHVETLTAAQEAQGMMTLGDKITQEARIAAILVGGDF